MDERNKAISKITKMPEEQVSKILIFMAGMEAEHSINQQPKKETHILTDSRELVQQ